MTPLTLAYWPATQELPLAHTTCGGVLRTAADTYPTRIALVAAHPDPTQRRRWTYAQLWQEAERTAHALLVHFEPGEHVAVWGGNSPEWVILQFGLALAGLVMVTVNPASLARELAYVLRQSGARGVFYQKTYRDVALRAVLDEALVADSLAIRVIECLDDLANFSSTAARRRADPPPAERGQVLPTIQVQQACMIQYTSGTTGPPKGALLNHYSVTNNSRLMAQLKHHDATTINLAVAPLFHTAGCVANVLGTAQVGGALLLPTQFEPELMLDLIEQEQVTYTFGVPTMLIALLAAQARRPRDLSSLKTVFSGATNVPVAVVQQVEAQFGVTLIIGYGQTETSPAITHTRMDDNAQDKSETIGRAIPQVEIKIIDPSSGATLPVDQAGELCTRGFLVMLGYYAMPEATQATIDEEGWLHTGDLCTMDARGYCRVTGRLKDLIIRGGENIYPREIEEVLYTHPAVAEVAVLGLPDDYWGEQVAAVLTLKPGAAPSAEDLRVFVATHLARHKVPTQWYALPELPATTSGKLQKFRLLESYRAGQLTHARL